MPAQHEVGNFGAHFELLVLSNLTSLTQLIYPHSFDKAHQPKACSTLFTLAHNDYTLLQQKGQLKITQLGHFNLIPLLLQK